MDDPKPTIEDLVSQITPENRHDYIPVSDPSFDRTRLLYRLSIGLIILNTLILCFQIITNR
jgi:hypothetical protein